MPKVSVVIPSYNAMAYLPETVDSVITQTFTDFEVLIVNDGSSDNIVEWASQFKDPRIKLISQENQGVCVARNTGIVHAQGKYIAFLDADDLWDPTKLEKQVLCLDDSQSVGLVHTWMVLIDQHGNSTGRVMISDTTGKVWKQLAEKNTIACSSVMVRRCCFEKVGMFAPILHAVEDWDMWIRIAAHYSFAVINEPLLLYRQHFSNSSKNWQAMEQAFHLVIERTFESKPKELLFLKDRSYGHASLCLAWKALQSKDNNYKQADRFRKQALVNYDQLRYSQEYIRLSLAILMMRWFGDDIYAKLLSLAYSFRRRIPLNMR
ncbi:MAG: glycosyltransferase family A protein [Kovacikia sp.]